MIDYDKAATKAAETLIKFGIKRTPISPLPILEQMENVIVVSFADLSETTGVSRSEILPLFGKNRDAVSSFHPNSEQPRYVIAYNSLLPFAMIQKALARELGHIVLKHEGTSEENNEDKCFARHLICPRPLIHDIQATSMRVTTDLIANLTGVYDQMIVGMRRTPGTNVPAAINRFVSNQFRPFVINFFQYYQYVMPNDGSALVDWGTFMDGYVE